MMIYKYLAVVLVFVSTVANGQVSHAHTPTKSDTLNKKSIPQEEHAQIGDTHITILYTAPAVRGRVIWGGLITYDEVWVTGAHKATSFEIDRDFRVGDKKIAAGKYAVFTIPGKDKWVFILNKNWDQHLADDYNQDEDVLRFEVTPRVLPSVQERLNYTVTELSEKEAILSISWEKVKINVPLALNR